MINIIKLLAVPVLLIGSLLPASAQSAPRAADGNNKIIIKLQAMVKEMASERDQLKAEKDKLAAEIDQLKKENIKAASAEDRLNSELSAQKESNAAVSSSLQQTHARLLEVIEKYNVLNKSKNELSAQHVNLQNIQKQTSSELKSCENKNLKMFEAAEDLLNRYDNKGVMDELLQDEPILQFKSVEMQNIVQEYEDKLLKQKYQHKDIAATNTKALETGEAKQP
jgi:hypothetical protein